jgi:magnesium chelatase family protein
VLRASGQVVFDDEGCLFLGELRLDGALRHTKGILPMVALARDRGIRTVFVPAIDAQAAALVEGVTIIPVATLGARSGHLRGALQIPAAAPMQFDETDEPPVVEDFVAVRGQEHLKRALEVAAAGAQITLLPYPLVLQRRFEASFL